MRVCLDWQFHHHHHHHHQPHRSRPQPLSGLSCLIIRLRCSLSIGVGGAAVIRCPSGVIYHRESSILESFIESHPSRCVYSRVIHRELSIEMHLFQSSPSTNRARFFLFFLFLFKSYVQNLAWLVVRLLDNPLLSLSKQVFTSLVVLPLPFQLLLTLLPGAFYCTGLVLLFEIRKSLFVILREDLGWGRKFPCPLPRCQGIPNCRAMFLLHIDLFRPA